MVDDQEVVVSFSVLVNIGVELRIKVPGQSIEDGGTWDNEIIDVTVAGTPSVRDVTEAIPGEEYEDLDKLIIAELQKRGFLNG